MPFLTWKEIKAKIAQADRRPLPTFSVADTVDIGHHACTKHAKITFCGIERAGHYRYARFGLGSPERSCAGLCQGVCEGFYGRSRSVDSLKSLYLQKLDYLSAMYPRHKIAYERGWRGDACIFVRIHEPVSRDCSVTRAGDDGVTIIEKERVEMYGTVLQVGDTVGGLAVAWHHMEVEAAVLRIFLVATSLSPA